MMVRDFYSRDGRRQAFVYPYPPYLRLEDEDKGVRIKWHVAMPNGRGNDVVVFDTEEKAVKYVKHIFPDVREV